MVYLKNPKKVIFDNKNYIIVTMTFKGSKVPVIFDDIYYEKLKALNKSWKINDYGFVVSKHKKPDNDNDTDKEQDIEISLHEVIMAFYNKENGLSKKNNNIIHINKLGIDNRKENLLYDTLDKETGKNSKKKKRIIEFREEVGIKPNDIPSFMWYLKPNGTHDERFIIEIGDIHWKTTSCSKLSLRYKLEEGKKYLRELKEAKPEIFLENSMNGEFNLKGKKLLKSFFDISSDAGFNNLKKLSTDNLTNYYLKQKLKGLTTFEKDILKNNTFYGIKRSRKVYNNIQ